MHRQKTSRQLKILMGILMAEDRVGEEEANTPSSIQFVPEIPQDDGDPSSWVVNNLRREDGQPGKPGIFVEVGQTPWEIKVSIRGDSPQGFHVEDMEGIFLAVDHISGYL